jgi:hypothetical protein
MLLVRGSSAEAPWDLPGGTMPERLDPAEFLRRLCFERLGLAVPDLVPQEAFPFGHGTHQTVYLYYAATVAEDHALPLGYVELRWCSAAEMRTLPLSAAAAEIAMRSQK